MASKNKTLFSGIAEAASKREEKAQGVGAELTQRLGRIGDLSHDEAVHKTLRRVDPARCRMWAHHNRRYELLNESRCRDLIEGIKAQNGQEFPAVVRRLKNDPNHDFEVICGARRHWAIQYLRSRHYNFPFLIEVRELSDEEAFRLADIENRDRQDISDYERALDYLAALDRYYDGNQSRMAERLEVGNPWLSRYLELARLPPQIVAAYADVTHIKESHARALKPMLDNSRDNRSTRSRVLEKAQTLAETQTAARAKGEQGLDGATVVRLLTAAAKPDKAAGRQVKVYKASESGAPMLEVSSDPRRGIALRVIPNSGATPAEMLQAIETILTERCDAEFCQLAKK